MSRKFGESSPESRKKLVAKHLDFCAANTPAVEFIRKNHKSELNIKRFWKRVAGDKELKLLAARLISNKCPC